MGVKCNIQPSTPLPTELTELVHHQIAVTLNRIHNLTQVFVFVTAIHVDSYLTGLQHTTKQNVNTELIPTMDHISASLLSYDYCLK